MALRDACASWLSAPEGRLCAWQQARALALREASAEIHGAPWLPWIAERVTKVESRHGFSLHLAQLHHFVFLFSSIGTTFAFVFFLGNGLSGSLKGFVKSGVR